MDERRKRWLRTRAAAEHCGFTESTFEKKRITGMDCPPYSKIGRTIVYDVFLLDSWMEDHCVDSTSEVASESKPQRRRAIAADRAGFQGEAR
jgi:hypothetical protein